MVIEFLEKESAGYYLLLDGFDDLLVEEKEILMREIKEFSEDVRYLILSRPYGFHDFNYTSRSVYEMLGFDENGCEAFLNHYFGNRDIDIDLAFLHHFLRSHPVLSVLSKSPLNLTRIAALTSSSPDVYALLEKVESEIDLLHLFNSYLGIQTN